MFYLIKIVLLFYVNISTFLKMERLYNNKIQLTRVELS